MQGTSAAVCAVPTVLVGALHRLDSQMVGRPMADLYLTALLHRIWCSDRLVLWTWPRMMEKTRLVWRADGI